MDPAAEHVIVAHSRSEPQSAELSLVLTASGIEHRRTPGPQGGWLLVVPAAEAARAAAELRAYQAEHTDRPQPAPPVEEVGGAWIGVAAYAATLMLVATFARQYALGVEWLAAGGLVAGCGAS